MATASASKLVLLCSMRLRYMSGLVCLFILLNLIVALYVVPRILQLHRKLPLNASSTIVTDANANNSLLNDQLLDDNGNGIGTNRVSRDRVEIDASRKQMPQQDVKYLIEPRSKPFCVNSEANAVDDDDVSRRRVSQSSSVARRARLLIVVCSSVENIDRRRAIRSTWGQRDLLSRLGANVVFVLAKPHELLREQRASMADDPTDYDYAKKTKVLDVSQYVADESRRFDDVVQLSFIDNYVNLTLKTLGALHWAFSRCPDVDYVIKTDDDIYLNVAELLRRLETEENNFRSTFHVKDDIQTRSFILGHVIDNARPVRIRRAKWYTPETVFDGEFYPPYTSGTGYAMSIDVVRRLLIEAEIDSNTRSQTKLSSRGTRPETAVTSHSSSALRGRRRRGPFWLEDVYVTGMLAANLADVRLVHDQRFNAVRQHRHRQRLRRLDLDLTGGGAVDSVDDEIDLQKRQTDEVCWYLRDAITTHDTTARELVQMWSQLRTALMSANTESGTSTSALQIHADLLQLDAGVVDLLCGRTETETGNEQLQYENYDDGREISLPKSAVADFDGVV